ncbi:putative sulfate exporter family transporter [Flammeovirgaceae bacterium SG7u.111]|nr:putative sulfate exporter family transporter [Flammeovirgaceae bacterium SG7u.132]WPO36602.1 putative sulfate exporter family transporter [Flammeovirgaceae bacterium SG7u.111]
MSLSQKQISGIYLCIIALCLFPFISPALALGLGLVLSFFGLKHKKSSNYTTLSLQASIVLMGFGMNLSQVVTASKGGFLVTAVSVFFVLGMGFLLTKLLKVDGKTGLLISAGTAICGGSAIAAVSPILNAKNSQVSFALIVVFILNAIALVVFPAIGHYFNMSQETFGTWAAIAIHDTSSVVGAGATYGAEALEIATTVKLIRALWIVPVALLITFVQKEKTSGKVKIPWFIGLFLLSIVVAHFFPSQQEAFGHLNWLGKRGMVVAIFLIGSNISLAEAKNAGAKTFVLGVLLWILIAAASFLMLTSVG